MFAFMLRIIWRFSITRFKKGLEVCRIGSCYPVDFFVVGKEVTNRNHFQARRLSNHRTGG